MAAVGRTAFCVCAGKGMVEWLCRLRLDDGPGGGGDAGWDKRTKALDVLCAEGQGPWIFAPGRSDGAGSGIPGCPTIFTSLSFPEPLPEPSRMLSSDAGRERPFLFGEGVRDVGCVPGKDSSFLFPGAKLLPYFRGLLLF